MRLNRVRSRASAHPLVTRLVLAGFLAALLAFSQREPGMADRYKQMSADFERKRIAELTNDSECLGEWMYNITVMGKPSAKDPWGWQLDGHHAIINYFVLGDQVVMTPYFAGSEPVIATSGKYKGTVILQDEQDKGFAMFKALTDAQRKKAVLNFSN